MCVQDGHNMFVGNVSAFVPDLIIAVRTPSLTFLVLFDVCVEMINMSGAHSLGYHKFACDNCVL
jgi:hypothetical protein